MGIWDVNCLICAGPIENGFTKGNTMYGNDDEIKITVTKREYNWLNNLVVLLSTGKLLTIKGSTYNGDGNLIVNKKKYSVTPVNWHADWDKNDGYGIVCHKDCYNLLDKSLKYKIVFGNVCRLVNDFGLMKLSKYGVMKKYISQFFYHYEADKENSWLLHSPLKNIKNKERILKTWKPLIAKFKKNVIRPSPCESATLFKSGKVLIGSDGKEWTVKSMNGIKKWVIK